MHYDLYGNLYESVEEALNAKEIQCSIIHSKYSDQSTHEFEKKLISYYRQLSKNDLSREIGTLSLLVKSLNDRIALLENMIN